MTVAGERRGWCWTVLAACLLGAGGLLALSAPVWLGWLPRCRVYAATGWHCPGCGGTRAVLALLDGDFFGALGANPLLISFGLLGVVFGLRAVWRERRGLVPVVPEISLRWGWLLGLGIGLFMVLRNVPWWPWSWLAPG